MNYALLSVVIGRTTTLVRIDCPHYTVGQEPSSTPDVPSRLVPDGPLWPRSRIERTASI